MKKPSYLNKSFAKIIFAFFLSFASATSANAQMTGIAIPGQFTNPDIFAGEATISADGTIIAGSFLSDIQDSKFFIIKNGAIETATNDRSSVYDISYDGSTIIGSNFTPVNMGVEFSGFIYKDNRLSLLPRTNNENSEIYGTSANGAILVGRMGDNAIRIENNIITQLPTINNNQSQIASAISADGSVIAGYSYQNNDRSVIFKYVDGEMTNLGFVTLNNASYGGDVRAISYDGSTITGVYDLGVWEGGSFKYDAVNGFVDLGDLGGNSTTVRDISATGKIIVGDSRDANNRTRAFKYTSETGIIDLGTLGGNNAIATSITPDGRVIVGFSETGIGNEVQIFILKAAAGDNMISVENTLQVLNQNANQLNSILNLKENLLNFSLNQDAKLFGKNNMHFAAGARVNSVDKSQETGGNFKFAYRFNDNFRAGIFADYGLNSNLPNNFKTHNNIPTTTIFSTISSDAKDSALFLKMAASYAANNLDITRQTLENTEAGKGRANLSTKGFLAQIGYGFNIANHFKITPYIGARFSEVLRKSYSETSGADFPISFQAARKKATTALLGGNIEWQISPNLNSRFGFGFEKDLSASLEGYKGNISYLGSFDLTSRKIRKNRYMISSGLSYKIAALQELSFDAQYGEQSLISSSGLAGYVNYAIGF